MGGWIKVWVAEVISWIAVIVLAILLVGFPVFLGWVIWNGLAK
jgi:hypothetical protein